MIIRKRSINRTVYINKDNVSWVDTEDSEILFKFILRVLLAMASVINRREIMIDLHKSQDGMSILLEC